MSEAIEALKDTDNAKTTALQKDLQNTAVSDAIEALKDTDEAKITALQKDLQFLIGHLASRITYAETRRNTFAVIGSACLAASIGLLTLTLTKLSENRLLCLPMLILSSGGALVGAFTWIVYLQQTNFRYPFTQSTNTWKWFYRYALQNHEEFDARTFPYQRKSDIEAGKRAFESQWKAFLARQVPGLIDPRVNASQDLEQVYLLHVNERYKNLFLTKLRNVLVRGILLVFAAFAVALCGVVLWPQTSSSGSFRSNRAGVTAEWRDTGATRASGSAQTEVQMLVNLRVPNARRVTTANIVGRDDHGLVVPLYVESANSIPGTPDRWVVLLWIPQPVRPLIDAIDVSP